MKKFQTQPLKMLQKDTILFRKVWKISEKSFKVKIVFQSFCKQNFAELRWRKTEIERKSWKRKSNLSERKQKRSFTLLSKNESEVLSSY